MGVGDVYRMQRRTTALGGDECAERNRNFVVSERRGAHYLRRVDGSTCTRRH